MMVNPPSDSNNLIEKGNISHLAQSSYDENKEDIEWGSLEGGQLYVFVFEIGR